MDKAAASLSARMSSMNNLHPAESHLKVQNCKECKQYRYCNKGVCRKCERIG